MNHTYPESLPTLPVLRAICTRRRVYSFENGDFRLKEDSAGRRGGDPSRTIKTRWPTSWAAVGHLTGLISDVYYMFRPSKNSRRGFDQWTFLRGQEKDPARSGPKLSLEEIDHWVPTAMRGKGHQKKLKFIQQCIMNIHDRRYEKVFFAPFVLRQAALWLQQNQDPGRFFLTVECFDPDDPWLAPVHYRKMYLCHEGFEQIVSAYDDVAALDREIPRRS